MQLSLLQRLTQRQHRPDSHYLETSEKDPANPAYIQTVGGYRFKA